MFDSLTATGTVGTAATFAASILVPLEVVIGFAVTLILASWVVAKFRGGRGRRRRRSA